VLQALPPKLRLARGLRRTSLPATRAGSMLPGAGARAVLQCAAARRQRVRTLATPLSRWSIPRPRPGRFGNCASGRCTSRSCRIHSWSILPWCYMKAFQSILLSAIAIFTLLSVPAAACAARARYRYVPAPTAADPGAYAFAGGEKLSTFGTVLSTGGPPRATNIVSYRHPYTGRPARVPIAFPLGTPNVQYRGDRVVYDYDTFTVSVRFLTDGSVEVTYNSGFLRDI